MRPKILVVEDNKAELDTLTEVLASSGYDVLPVLSAEKALALSKKESFDLMITDLVLPGINGIELMEKIKRAHPQIETILITGHATVETAIDAMKKGAYDYLVKPIKIKRLRVLIEKAFEVKQARTRVAELEGMLFKKAGFMGIIGESEPMQKMFERIRMVAPTDSTVLILGESGSGKELVANALHKLSPRKEKPLIKVNCAALPESLLESELFGYEKGAFTGADRRKPGKFELADGGTIFLDEISEISPAVQAKLLRVLEDKTIEPLGSTTSKRVDVRIIAATNRNLTKLVRDGRFREDLYYRLRVITLSVPPLREHPEDIPLLVSHFLKLFSKRFGKDIKGVSSEVMKKLQNLPWHGNVRELKNTVQEMVVFTSKDYITELPSISNESNTTEPDIIPLSELERQTIEKALIRFKGNKKKVAEALGISLRTLYRKIEEYKIRPNEEL
ncbi:sigma-54-dependent Fis family transcriptional regulator [bacterium]|nr:sigma-54-dependent Fis family transcriptional regulator [bacterium]